MTPTESVKTYLRDHFSFSLNAVPAAESLFVYGYVQYVCVCNCVSLCSKLSLLVNTHTAHCL